MRARESALRNLGQGRIRIFKGIVPQGLELDLEKFSARAMSLEWWQWKPDFKLNC